MSTTTSRDHSKAVSQRFLKAMKYIIAEELEGVRFKSAFAEKVGEHQQNLSRIEKGERYATIDMLVNTCEIFGVDPAWMFLGRGTMFPKQKSATGTLKDDLASVHSYIKGIENRLNEIEKATGSLETQTPKRRKKAS